MASNKFILAILGFIQLVSSKDNCYYSKQCAYPLYSSKTPYDTVRGDIRDHPGLEGCEAISVWTLNRHGNRNPGNSVTASIKDISRLKQEIVNSWEKGSSQLCAQDIDAFNKWIWNDTMDISPSFLTGVGYEELYDLAKRIRQKYPGIFESATNRSLYFRPTNEQRTITSATAFANGLLEGTNLNATIDEPWDIDMVIRPYSFCDRYQQEIRGENSQSHIQIAAFQNTPEYIVVQEAVQKRLGITHQLSRDEIYDLYEICRFFRSWEPNLKSPWCAVFSEEDLVVLEYRDDIRHYYRNGYASWLNVKLGQLVLKDLYENFLASVNGHGQGLVSYFSHDTMLQMTFSALGLFKDDFKLLGNNIVPNRQWRTSYIAAFSTNIVAVLNRCGQSPNITHKVQFFVNEKETPICPVSGCTWEQFRDKFEPYLNSSTDFCSLNYTGPQPDAAVTNKGVLIFVALAQFGLYSLSSYNML